MNIAVIFAGGIGRRMNSKERPKQFIEMFNKPIIIHTIEHFEKQIIVRVEYIIQFIIFYICREYLFEGVGILD